MMYGKVDISPLEIAHFQERISSDIAIPLDKPTGLVGRSMAEKTVEETLSNVKITIESVGPDSRCVWVAPIQGGVYTDLIERCIDMYEKMGFSLYCLGSPTPLMTSYKYDALLKMVTATRLRLSIGKPLHLFGAGHPMIFSFIVALGCDLFDSASYALFALEDRYILPDRTVRLEQLSTLPCSCRVCQTTSVKELKGMPKNERLRLLAWHNLATCFEELKIVKQALWEGRLFELLEKRARAHPALYEAFKQFCTDGRLSDILVRHTPISKKRGLLLFDELSLQRPEVKRAITLLRKTEINRNRVGVAVLLNYRLATVKNHLKLLEKVRELVGEDELEILTYGTPYGLVPFSLVNFFPYSQTSFPTNLLRNMEEKLLEEMAARLESGGFKKVVLLDWGRDVYPGFVKRLSGFLKEKLTAEFSLLKV